jgi:two-component system NtrC family sensor kinase
MSKKLASRWGISWLSNLKIARKIGCGYAVAIGIAVLGAIGGLMIGDFYQRKAQKQLLQVSEQRSLLDELEYTIFKARSHPQELIAVLGDSIWFQYEVNNFTSDSDNVKTLLLELDALSKKRSNSLPVNSKTFRALLFQQSQTFDEYVQLIESLHQQIEPSKLTPDRLPEARQQVVTAIAGLEAIRLRVEFERFSENLTRIAQKTEQQYEQANQEAIRANTLRLQIILLSMLCSVAIAIFLAFFTSRAIAHPLEALTQVAQRVTKEGNLHLQATVISHDEIGTLSTSFNQLIQWVSEYTERLEEARKNLEQRVDERTVELTQTLRDLKETQSQLIQTEKMSGLGQMVAGVAHEINNPVNFIHGNLTYINRYFQEIWGLIELYQNCHCSSPKIDEYIEQIDLEFIFADLPKVLHSMKIGTERIQSIVLSLRNFSRLDESEQKAVDIHEGIENTLVILNHRIKNKVEILKKYDHLPLIACYPSQLNQVFMNIIANALDAMFEAEIEKKQLEITTEKSENRQIKVRIKDNGKGIPAEVKDKLFDPFFTTKPVGKGTGLGLSICYQIIEKHQGEIEVISEPGWGTEFTIALPLKSG